MISHSPILNHRHDSLYQQVEYVDKISLTPLIPIGEVTELPHVSGWITFLKEVYKDEARSRRA